MLAMKEALKGFPEVSAALVMQQEMMGHGTDNSAVSESAVLQEGNWQNLGGPAERSKWDFSVG